MMVRPAGLPMTATSLPSRATIVGVMLEFGAEVAAKRDLRRALFDSLDVVARAQGELRPR